MGWATLVAATLGQGTRKTQHDALKGNIEYLQAKADRDHSVDSSDTGTGDHNFSIAEPMHMTVAADTVWTLGWWQSADGRWWLLVNTADVTSFTRAQAEFYIPTGSLSDVPTT